MTQSVKRPTSAQVMVSRSVSSSPASGSVLTPGILQPALDSVSPSLSAPPPLTLCLYQKINKLGAPGWRSRLSVRLQPGYDLAVREFEPRVGLWADGLEPASNSVSPSLSAPPPFMLCLSLSPKKINKR